MANIGAFPISGSSQAVVAASATRDVGYFGFSLRETAGSAAVVRIRAAGVITGDILDTVSLLGNESAREWYGPQGIKSRAGLYVEIVSGTVEGSIRYA